MGPNQVALAFRARALARGNLVRSGETRRELHCNFVTAASSLGFDGVSYFLMANDDSRAPDVHWTTAGGAWSSEYVRHAFHVNDPRISQTRRRLCPLVWGRETFAGDVTNRDFRVAAERHGIRSGVAISIRDERIGRGVICLDSSRNEPASERSEQNARRLGDLLLSVVLFLDALLSAPVCGHAAIVPRLTLRERECLMLASNGMTSADIGSKLTIAERTVHFHFANITAKLGALNRAEAIGRAIAEGVIPGPARFNLSSEPPGSTQARLATTRALAATQPFPPANGR